jgi:diaminohydroxyphosphoribosylaminopyrimidine deaminase/5-amino-6-(5-phosphoribosylamino)uracil reductase
MTFTSDDKHFMARALELAERGRYSSKPNPSVGCVIVLAGQIVGEGWHEKAGEPHAEVNALRQAGVSANNATAYVTLEPCSHYGRTPPCADALIKASITRVVVAMQDPNPLVAGKGLAKLRDAGMTVETGLLKAQAEELNKDYCHKMKHGKPHIISKVAMSLDGKTAMASGESKWITGPLARQDVHLLRAQSDALLTGVGTILADDPQLTARDGLDESQVSQPRIIVVDSKLQTPLDAAILSGEVNTTILTCSTDSNRAKALRKAGCRVDVLPADKKGHVDLREVQKWLSAQAINSVLIEAGAVLNGACINTGMIDELIVYIAPSVLGSGARAAFAMPDLTHLADRIQLNLMSMDTIGGDIKLSYKTKLGR